MRKVILVINVFLYLASYGQAGDSLTLNFCYDEATKNYPLIKQKELLASASELKIKNIDVNYRPQIFLNGQATYQSDVTKIPQFIPNMKIPELSKDSYKATLDINQLIYDGNLTKRQRSLEKSSLEADQQNLDVQLYQIKNSINQIYFSILLFQSNEKILKLAKDNLQYKLVSIESGVKNGAMLESNADVIKAELLRTDQQLLELNMGEQAAIKMLGDFINKNLSDSIKLSVPNINVSPVQPENSRPEMKLFDLQIQKIQVSKDLLSSKLSPRVSAFGQAGYGRPGFNMLSNDFQPFYIIGARLNWNLWNWNQTSNEKKLMDLQSNILNTQKEAFDKNLKIAQEKDIAEIHKYEILISKDIEIINLQVKITANSFSQLINGVITATDFITVLRSELQSKLNLEAHKIQLIQARVNYLNNAGKL
ncbi:MAG: TolC family protein [Bacteroidales bacterium]|nr:TolC family protein [Bacteroidales bacterium]